LRYGGARARDRASAASRSAPPSPGACADLSRRCKTVHDRHAYVEHGDIRTTQPPSCSIRLRSLSRMTAWSSANRTRIGCTSGASAPSGVVRWAQLERPLVCNTGRALPAFKKFPEICRGQVVVAFST
jgi:hypothetical protein